MKKIAFWGIVFALFGTYAAGVLTYAYQAPGVEAAYAETIKKNDAKEKKQDNHVEKEEKKSRVYIVTSPRQNPFVRILERLRIRAAHERELCEVSEDELHDLQKSNSFNIEEMEVDGGETVKVATPHAALFSDDFKKRDIHCLKLSIFERLILMFSAHVS